MSYIYAISDIHGYYEQMIDSLKVLDLKNLENNIIFLGDYIDRGNDSCKVLYYVKELYESYPEQVTILLGNHDEMFLNWLYFQYDEVKWLSQDHGMTTVKSFFTVEEYKKIIGMIQTTSGYYDEISMLFKEEIKKKHNELLEWLLIIFKQPRYIETEQQIFVHAGILEEAEDLWKHGTPQEYFTQKYPAEIGYFYKDIIAGHVSSAEVANKQEYLGRVFWDGESHFYIDGTVEESGTIPVLKYDTKNRKYSFFEKDKPKHEWREVFVNL